MERRGFLKACAALLAAPLLDVPEFSLIVPSQSLLPGQKWFSTVREICAYDIIRDCHIIRYDIMGKGLQFGVDMVLTREDIERDGLQKHRDIVAELFGNEMRHNGINISDLRPLPIPAGYVEPDIMKWAQRKSNVELTGDGRLYGRRPC